MNTLRIRVLSAILAASAGCAAQAASFEGVLATGIGGSLQSGNRAKYQADSQHRKLGYGGIEELRLTRELANGAILTFDGKLMAGDGDYLFDVRLKKDEVGHLKLGYEQFRVWYDGAGGYFPATNTLFRLYDEAMHVDRSKFWFEAASNRPGKLSLKLRYEHSERTGEKGSTVQADYNVPIFSTRSIVPTFLGLDEKRDTVTIDLAHANDTTRWGAGGRYTSIELSNTRNSRRQPGLAADRIVTTRDNTKTDLVSAHAYAEHKVNEKLTVSTGGIVTSLDANLDGTRIYGQSYDPVYDPAYLRRQQRDEGYARLSGESEMKQYVFNANVLYKPAKNWIVRPTFRVEAQRTESMAHFLETIVQANGSMLEEDVETMSDKKWVELTEAIEVRYTGVENMTHSFKAEWLQASGDLEEERLLEHTGATTIDRATDMTRRTQKYAYTANWYARPGLTLAAQYYYKVRVNDNDAVRDSTVSTSDRYPAYITDQDFETNDFNVRLSWRPAGKFSSVTRYDYQRSTILSQEAGLGPVQSAKNTSHIVAQNFTVTPHPRVYVTAGATLTYDQIATPAIDTAIVRNGDNNYTTGNLMVGVAASDRDDLVFNATYFSADNFFDNSAVTLPYGSDETQRVAAVTWTHRRSENLVYTFRYSYYDYKDRAAGTTRDYEAHQLYGKVQYRF